MATVATRKGRKNYTRSFGCAYITNKTGLSREARLFLAKLGGELIYVVPILSDLLSPVQMSGYALNDHPFSVYSGMYKQRFSTVDEALEAGKESLRERLAKAISLAVLGVPNG